MGSRIQLFNYLLFLTVAAVLNGILTLQMPSGILKLMNSLIGKLLGILGFDFQARPPGSGFLNDTLTKGSDATLERIGGPLSFELWDTLTV